GARQVAARPGNARAVVARPVVAKEFRPGVRDLDGCGDRARGGPHVRGPRAAGRADGAHRHGGLPRRRARRDVAAHAHADAPHRPRLTARRVTHRIARHLSDWASCGELRTTTPIGLRATYRAP